MKRNKIFGKKNSCEIKFSKPVVIHSYFNLSRLSTTAASLQLQRPLKGGGTPEYE